LRCRSQIERPFDRAETASRLVKRRVMRRSDRCGLSPLGAKGLGELTAVSVAPAIANAVYHATGKRVRDLPITIEKLL
jgi:CO/xanthine dehydrogenase Mo-binding subunit